MNRRIAQLRSIELFYWLTGALVAAAVPLYFVHPNETVDLVVSVYAFSFTVEQPASGEPLLKAVPTSLLGFRGLSQLQLSTASVNMISGASGNGLAHNLDQLGFERLNSSTAIAEDSQIVLLGRINLARLFVTEHTRLRLSLRNDTTRTKVLLEANSGRLDVHFQLLSNNATIHSQDMAVRGRKDSTWLPLSEGQPIHLEVRQAEDGSENEISFGEAPASLFFDIRDLRMAINDMVNGVIRLSRIDWRSAESEASATPDQVVGQCVSVAVGDRKLAEWSDRQVFFLKDDLNGFDLTRVRSSAPGRLELTMRGETDVFRAGLNPDLSNRIPSALASVHNRIGVLVAILIWIGQLSSMLIDRLKKGGKS